MKLLCNVMRGERTESEHEVYAKVIDGDGKTIFSTGRKNYITCIRSALKPFQASAVISSGAIEKAGFIREIEVINKTFLLNILLFSAAFEKVVMCIIRTNKTNNNIFIDLIYCIINNC